MALSDVVKADKDKVIGDLNQSTHQLIKQLAVFDASKFNKRPSMESWTPGEVTEHLLLLDILIGKAINGASTKANRDPLEKVPAIKRVFENVERRLTSPDFIKPSDTIKDPNSMMQRIQQQRHAIAQTIQSKDLTEICTGFQHPAFSEFTRIEWIYFSIYHAERHLVQLKKMTTSFT